MVYLANFENVDKKKVKLFIFNGTNLVSLQDDITIQNLPENVSKWIREINLLTFQAL